MAAWFEGTGVESISAFVERHGGFWPRFVPTQYDTYRRRKQVIDYCKEVAGSESRSAVETVAWEIEKRRVAQGFSLREFTDTLGKK